jgi:hypothetical protein
MGGSVSEPNNASKNKGQGKGKSEPRSRMPQALIGKLAVLPDGRRLCFNFNMAQGCPNAPPGGACDKGHHICCEPGCGQAHSLTRHSA